MRLSCWIVVAVLLLSCVGCNFGTFGADVGVNIGYGIRDSGGRFDPVELVVGAVGAAFQNMLLGAFI